MIQIKNLTRSFHNGKIQALSGVSFEIADTGLTCICGKSGSGKTTLVNVLGLLDTPTSGDVIIDGVCTASLRASEKDAFRNSVIGFVSQDYGLISELSVYENCALALELQSGDEEANRGYIGELLNRVGLSGYEKRRINELSGGEKQRVSIVRCLAQKASVILCDEPTGNLDSDTTDEISALLKELSKTVSVIVVTHNKRLAAEYGDRTIVLENGTVVSDTEAGSALSPTEKNRQSKRIIKGAEAV